MADLAASLGGQLEVVAVSERKGEALLSETVRGILAHFDRNKDFLSQMISGGLQGSSARLHGRSLEQIGANVERVERILRRCASDGLFELKDSRYPALALVSLCRGAMLQKILDGGAGPLEKETGKVTAFFLRGLGSAR